MVTDRENLVAFSLKNLNEREDGSSIFQNLANILANKVIYSNLIPTSLPSYGGDKGADGRSITSHIEPDQLELMISGASQEIGEGEIIIAISIRSDFEKKIEDDVKTILKNFNPKEIIFMTNQNIHPEKKKIELEEKVKIDSKLKFRILDYSFFYQHLLHDHYSLAVDYLGCPKELDPLFQRNLERKLILQEKGVKNDEIERIQSIREKIRYRNTVSCSRQKSGQLALELKELLENNNEDWRTELLLIYKDIISNNDFILPQTLAKCYYNFFHCLFGPERSDLEKINTDKVKKILELFPTFRDIIINNKLFSQINDIVTWILFIHHWIRDKDEFNLIWNDTVKCLEEFLKENNLALMSKAYIKEALYRLKCFNFTIPLDTYSCLALEGRKFAEEFKDVYPFDFGRMAYFYSESAIIISHKAPDIADELEVTARILEGVLTERDQSHRIGIRMSQRGLEHVKNDQITYGMTLIDEAKDLFLNPNTKRKYYVNSMILSNLYLNMKFMDTARWEVWNAINYYFSEIEGNKIEKDFWDLIKQAIIVELSSGRYVFASKLLIMSYRLINSEFRESVEFQESINSILSNYLLLIKYLKLNDNETLQQVLDTLNGHFELINLYLNYTSQNDENFDILKQGLTEDEQIIAKNLRDFSKEDINDFPNYFGHNFIIQIDDHKIKIEYEDSDEEENFSYLKFTCNVILQRFFVLCEDIIRYLGPYPSTIKIKINNDSNNSNNQTKFINPNVTNLTIYSSEELLNGLLDRNDSTLILFSIELLSNVLYICTVSSFESIIKFFTPEEMGEIFHSFHKILPPYRLSEMDLWNSVYNGGLEQ